MTPTILGFVFIGLGLGIFAFKAYVAHDSRVEGNVPVLDGALLPPLFIGCGTCLVRGRHSDALWTGIGIGVVCAIVFWIVISHLSSPDAR